MEHTFEEFAELAMKEFPGKLKVCEIPIDNETLISYNKSNKTHLTLDDFKNYGNQIWLLENKCPRCGCDLSGLFGSFRWELAHGKGYCSDCEEEHDSVMIFRYYHYVGSGDNKGLVTGFSLVGF